LLCCRRRGRRHCRRCQVHCGHRSHLAVVDCCFVLVPADAIIFTVITIVVVAIVIFVFNSFIILMFIPVVVVVSAVIVAAVHSIVAIIVVVVVSRHCTRKKTRTPSVVPHPKIVFFSRIM
jgi:hypothetical protein